MTATRNINDIAFEHQLMVLTFYNVLFSFVTTHDISEEDMEEAFAATENDDAAAAKVDMVINDVPSLPAIC